MTNHLYRPFVEGIANEGQNWEHWKKPRTFEQRLQDATTPEERAALVAKRLLGEPLSMEEQLAELQRRMSEIGLMPPIPEAVIPLQNLGVSAQQASEAFVEFSKALGL